MSDEVDETTDATTTFEMNQVAAHTYSESTEDRHPGIGTESGDSADEVDPRKLMGDPHINDIRWLYRSSWASTIVDKPVEDAFKNGYDISHDGEKNIHGILDDLGFDGHYREVRKKARRDGFALTFFVLQDSTDHVGDDPLADDVVVDEIKKVETITLDDLARYGTGRGAIAAGSEDDPLLEMDHNDYEIRPTGIVMDTDPQSRTYKEPLGYIIGPPEWLTDSDVDRDDVKFYHRNRFLHHVERSTVDGDLDQDALGRWEGDSVLVPSYHLLRGLKKGNWSIMQTIFRYAAKMYHVELPEDADEEDWNNANNNMQNLNSKSELLTPHGYNIEDFQTDGQLQPEEYFDVIFEQICASNEMTKSVLFGTQTGTTTGSETDIKNYFNKVSRERKSTFEDDMRDFVSRAVALDDGRAGSDYDLDFEVDWGPMFQLSQLDNTERLTRLMQSLSSAINDFVMTPGEAREILKQEWAEVDLDWDRDFSDEEQDFLQTLNVAQMGAEAVLPEEMQEESSRVGQNGGGREQGDVDDEGDPSTDSLTDDDVRRIAEEVVGMMQNE